MALVGPHAPARTRLGYPSHDFASLLPGFFGFCLGFISFKMMPCYTSVMWLPKLVHSAIPPALSLFSLEWRVLWKAIDIKLKLFVSFFTNSAPLGRVGHRVAMSVCLCVCAIKCIFFRGLSLALRSHDQIPASHWSTPPPAPPRNFI